MFKTYFFDVIKNHYFDYKGRATRKQFWMFTLCNAILIFILAFLGALSDSLSTVFNVLSFLYSLAIFLPEICLSIRRLHDINLRGWWLLICLVPAIGSLVVFIFYVWPSREPNRF